MEGNNDMSPSLKVIGILKMTRVILLLVFFWLSCAATIISRNIVHSKEKAWETAAFTLTICNTSFVLCISDNTQGPHFVQRWCERGHKGPREQTQANTGADADAGTRSDCENVLRPLLDGNLIWGLSILRTVIPRRHSRCSFSCFRAEASIPRNTHSLRCCATAMQRFHFFTPLPFLLESFLLFHFSYPMIGKYWNHASIQRLNCVWLVDLLIEGTQKLSESPRGCLAKYS